MSDTKVKAFAARILQECEQEGFTIKEALQIPQELKFVLDDRVKEIHASAKITGTAQ